jgi:prepilin-type N-terminal cleavage/methylation domain-containing protein
MTRRVRSTRLQRVRVRPGFTIVELLVAVMIFAVGVLALAGASASITEMSGSSARRVQAANIAGSRFETLRSLNCATLENGKVGASRGIAHWWTVKKVPATQPRTVEVTVTVLMAQRGGSKSYIFRNVFPC